VCDVEVRVGQILGAHPQLDRMLDRLAIDGREVVGIATDVAHEVDKHPDVVNLTGLVLGQDRGAIVLRARGVDGLSPPLLIGARCR
jgi:hypothetical protein